MLLKYVLKSPGCAVGRPNEKRWMKGLLDALGTLLLGKAPYAEDRVVLQPSCSSREKSLRSEIGGHPHEEIHLHSLAVGGAPHARRRV